MNEEPGAAPPPPPFETPEPDPRWSRREEPSGPLASVKAWLRDVKEFVQGAVEDAREASQEKQAEMRADYERRTRPPKL